ncbi:MAG: type II toxin-antitoxin system RelE/ParE family toxin [Lachnospiraceae bacterium]|nr:type II toxin-antitoxin system RelE/ParE family toxin [Lachnospiraceae bacterium]
MAFIYTKQAVKNIKNLDGTIKNRIKEGIEKIPFGDIKKLQGYNNLYRLRIGSYRVIYEVVADNIIIDAVLPRGEAYKRL